MDAAELKRIAEEAHSWFEVAKRPNTEEDSYFVRTKDDAPEWVTGIVYAAHHGFSDFLPDDYRYKWAMEACEFISEADDPEDGSSDFADQAVDVYTNDRLAWLSSNLNRASYCDEAAQNYGHDQVEIIDMIGWGQFMEAEEVYSLVLNALSEVSTVVEP